MVIRTGPARPLTPCVSRGRRASRVVFARAAAYVEHPLIPCPWRSTGSPRSWRRRSESSPRSSAGWGSGIGCPKPISRMCSRRSGSGSGGRVPTRKVRGPSRSLRPTCIGSQCRRRWISSAADVRAARTEPWLWMKPTNPSLNTRTRAGRSRSPSSQRSWPGRSRRSRPRAVRWSGCTWPATRVKRSRR